MDIKNLEYEVMNETRADTPEKIRYLADHYYYIEKDEIFAKKWYLFGDRINDIYCTYRAAIISLFGTKTEVVDFEEGLRFLEKCFKANNYRDSAYLLGCCCLYGYGTHRNPERAGWYLSKSLHSKSLFGIPRKAYNLMLQLSKCRKEGQDLHAVPPTSFFSPEDDLFQQAMYFRDKNDDQLFKLCLTSAAESGDSRALLEMGFYLISNTADNDYAQAMGCFKKAIAAGEPEGYEGVGWIYNYQGKYDEAYKWFCDAISHGSFSAGIYFGDQYRDGYWVADGIHKPGCTSAIDWYLLCGDNGYPEGYFEAGLCYMKGGVHLEADIEIGLQLLTKAAEQHYGYAINKLITYYEEHDKDKAQYWKQVYEDEKPYFPFLLFNDEYAGWYRVPASMDVARAVADECRYYEEMFPFDELEECTICEEEL